MSSIITASDGNAYHAELRAAGHGEILDAKMGCIGPPVATTVGCLVLRGGTYEACARFANIYHYDEYTINTSSWVTLFHAWPFVMY